jgi:hypothetical protein
MVAEDGQVQESRLPITTRLDKSSSNKDLLAKSFIHVRSTKTTQRRMLIVKPVCYNIVELCETEVNARFQAPVIAAGKVTLKAV